MRYIEKYEVLSIIGEGGMGKVFKIEDITNQNIYALKTAKIKSKFDSLNFINEAAIWFKFRSIPQVTEIVEIIKIDDLNIGIILEYIDTGNLRNLITNNSFFLRDRLISLYDVSMSIGECIKIMPSFSHNDIKPENCLRTYYGITKLSDFGIAKTNNIDVRSVLRNINNLNPSLSISYDYDNGYFRGGTPLYMSPEQILGITTDSHKSDVYSFGIMALEFLAGEHPMVNNNLEQIFIYHLKGLPSSLRKWPNKLSKKLRKVFDSSIDPSPQNRPSFTDISKTIIDELDSTARVLCGVSPRLPNPVESTMRQAKSLWALSQKQTALDILLESLKQEPYNYKGWIKASKWAFEIYKEDLQNHISKIYQWLSRGLILNKDILSEEIEYYLNIEKAMNFSTKSKQKEFLDNQKKWLEKQERELLKTKGGPVRCLCIKCGEMKLHMLIRCPKCGFFPRTKKDIFNTYQLRVVKINDTAAKDYFSKSKVLRIIGKNVQKFCLEMEDDPNYSEYLKEFFNTQEGKDYIDFASKGKIRKKYKKQIESYFKYLETRK